MDVRLSEHFSLDDLTKTNRAEFQEQNRVLDERQIQTLRNGAALLEAIQDIIAAPITVSSGYRYKALNDAEGSNDRSQHLKCEAYDFVPEGVEIEAAFRLIWKQVKEGKLNVGQLIFETATRSYGRVSWIHASLGYPWREASRSNQILRMEHGKYSMLNNLSEFTA